MKKINLFYSLTILFLMNMLSCSNEEFEDVPALQTPVEAFSEFATDSLYVINTPEDWFNLFGVEPIFENEELTTKSIMPRGQQAKQVIGYTSIKNSEKYRTMFSSEMAQQLGLRATTIYHVYMKYVKKQISLPTGGIAFTANSPGCGYKPITSPSNEEVSDFTDRGYKIITSQGVAEFETNILYVENEEWGVNIKKDCPCKPADLVWNYTLWTI